jgi:hypothetical protein
MLADLVYYPIFGDTKRVVVVKARNVSKTGCKGYLWLWKKGWRKTAAGREGGGKINAWCMSHRIIKLSTTKQQTSHGLVA